jgi:hypothetical protein
MIEYRLASWWSDQIMGKLINNPARHKMRIMQGIHSDHFDFTPIFI